MTTSPAPALTAEQQATYARYYVMLRDSSLSGGDPRVAGLVEAQADWLDRQGELTANSFDEVMGSVADLLGY